MVEYIGNEITYLLPGEMIVTSEPMKISTVLGSCVAVCLYDRENRVCGINHYLLPLNKTADPERNRYGDTSLEDMLQLMIRTGALKDNIVSRVYGGSSMFINTGPAFNIGEKNVEVALEFLEENGIPVNAIDTGGPTGRKVIFDTSAGEISCNLLKETLR